MQNILRQAIAPMPFNSFHKTRTWHHKTRTWHHKTHAWHHQTGYCSNAFHAFHWPIRNITKQVVCSNAFYAILFNPYMTLSDKVRHQCLRCHLIGPYMTSSDRLWLYAFLVYDWTTECMGQWNYTGLAETIPSGQYSYRTLVMELEF